MEQRTVVIAGSGINKGRRGGCYDGRLQLLASAFGLLWRLACFGV